MDSMPFWWVRTVSGLIIVTGQLFFFYALWATARRPAEGMVPAPIPAEAA
jgi:cbb3-type cytochrome oxidase subunit 1